MAEAIHNVHHKRDLYSDVTARILTVPQRAAA
jgi:hypothetical protein